METLDVALNRTGLKEAEAPETFAVGGSFVVALRNHGEAAHVHLQLDDQLRRIASIETTNHFVDGGAERLVTVDVREPDTPVTGTLAVVTGHGAETTPVRVTVHPEDDSVAVDESLAAPAGDAAPSTDGGGGEDPAAADAGGSLAAELDPQGVPDTATLAVVVLVVMVVIVAGVIAVTFNSPVVTLGVAAVVVAVAVAGYLLVT